jgi:beta-N-acetylhexosaminidase
VGELTLLSFQGTTLPSYVRDALRDGRATGAIVFDRNVSSPEQVKALTGGLQRAAGGRALIATDQEGGEARTLPYAAPAVAQSALPGPAAAAASARRSARDLHAAGVNVALAPVADVGVPGGALSARAYPGDPAAVADSVRAGVEGYEAAGVAATLKHFPGLGAAPANTDDAPVTLPTPRRRIEQRDLPPFRAGIEAGAPVVMVSHALYPELDPQRIASQSRPVVAGLLRDRLGFRGVAVTDSIEADAVLQRSSVGQAAVRSVAAGVDLVLMTGPGSFPRVRRALLREARRSPAFRRRVEESAARVRALKERLRR